MPLARRSFGAASTLHSWIELHGSGSDPVTGRPRATASYRARSRDGREWASGPATEMHVEGGRATRLLSVPLADAPAGENELVLA